ncbi:MAG TPA: hypothetical protein VKV15_24810 [Bryobacteraceae bacterium]|nr:hypothetical protein [Bryobacteraceae bacterium]
MKIIPPIDTYPGVVRFCETRWGKVALLLAFAIILLINGVSYWTELTLLAGVLSFLPEHREILLSLAALYWLVVHKDWTRWDFIHQITAPAQQPEWVVNLWVAALLAVIFGGIWLFFNHVRRRGGSFTARRPVQVLLSVYFAMLLAAGTLPLQGTARMLLWLLIALVAPYLWFFAYALQDAGSKSADRFPIQFGSFHPFYMSPLDSSTPFGKGRAYLRKTEARTSKDLSVVQLKAVKLLLWATFLHVVDALFVFLVLTERRRSSVILNHLFDRLHVTIPNFAVPDLEAAIDLTAMGVRLPVHVAWGSLVAHFIEALLAISISGHIAVACCRMSGFNILRNTYRPLQSQTIADFWNRYYYYFKELLVEFFFLPTYVRHFKKYRRLRLAVATFAAATFGNALYHFFKDFHYVTELGFWTALAGFRVYLLYSTILGAGIVASQLRSHKLDPNRPWFRRALASAGVLVFFCLLEVFDYEGRAHSLRTHFAFFMNLFSWRG